MKKRILIIIVILSVFLLNSCSQKYYVKKANKEYNKENYLVASINYNKALEKGKSLSDNDYLKVADTFYKMKDFDTAKKYYNKVDASNRDYRSQLNIAQILLFEKKYNKAKTEFQELKNKSNKLYNDTTVDKFIESCNLSLKNEQAEYIHYKIKESKINLGGESFGVCFYNDGVIYSAPKVQNIKNFIIDENNDVTDKYGNVFKNIFYSNIDEKGNITDSVLFFNQTKKNHHIGAVSYLADSSRFFFSETMKIGGNSVIKIFSVDKTNDGYTNANELSFNSNNYSCAHPSVTADGKFLYFTSDMKGGFGETDIYVSEYEDGKWGKPQNLGRKINTEASEMFPFIKETGVLYFSSNGKVGYGGFDIYYALNIDGVWTHVVHRGKPLNSYADDFAYTANPKDESKVYFSSNRDSEPGKDKIYFAQILVLPPDTIRGVLYDNLTDKQIFGVTLLVVIDSISGDTIASTYTNEKGEYVLIIPKKLEEDDEEHLFAVIKKDGYEDNVLDFEDRFDDDDRPPFKNKNVAMKVKIKKAQVIEFHNIYFDFGKADLKESSILVLDKLVEVMNENENMLIELSAHTDSKSSKRYNQKLSDKRANSAEKYILSKGIAPNRIVAKGYGETRLLNHCKDGVDCSDEEHALNRRIEVKILSN